MGESSFNTSSPESSFYKGIPEEMMRWRGDYSVSLNGGENSVPKV